MPGTLVPCLNFSHGLFLQPPSQVSLWVCCLDVIIPLFFLLEWSLKGMDIAISCPWQAPNPSHSILDSSKWSTSVSLHHPLPLTPTMLSILQSYWTCHHLFPRSCPLKPLMSFICCYLCLECPLSFFMWQPPTDCQMSVQIWPLLFPIFSILPQKD